MAGLEPGVSCRSAKTAKNVRISSTYLQFFLRCIPDHEVSYGEQAPAQIAWAWRACQPLLTLNAVAISAVGSPGGRADNETEAVRQWRVS
jgi:hypothetical protein